MSVPLVFTVRSRNAPASSSVRASIASHVSCTRTSGRPLCSGMLSATASRPGSASTIDDPLLLSGLAEVEREQRARRTPRGPGAPGTFWGAWMWPIATYCGPAGIACGVAA